MPKNNKTLSFSLFDIERAITQNEYTKFENYLIDFLEFVEHRNNIESIIYIDSNGKTACSHKGLIPFTNQITHNDKQDLYSRLAATISSYLSDSKYTPPDEFLMRFVLYKTHVTSIFYLSCYGNMDHILFNRKLLNDSLSLKLKTEQDIKLLYVCLSLNSRIQYDPEQLANALPNWGTYWFLGLLYGHQHSYNQQFEDNLNKIVDAHRLIQTMELDSTSVELSCSPWMLCSYLDRNDRHEIKKSINIAIRTWLDKQAPPGQSKRIKNYTDKTKEIKHIVILSEKIGSKHAMFRCYYTRIAELRKKYHVTLVSAEEDYDDAILGAVDNVVNVTNTAVNITNTIKKITSLKPDLIIYPSLGMAKWTVPLANMRLAKYQIMTYGHPASAFSPYIDYGVVTRFPAGHDVQKFCMEKVTPFHDETSYAYPHPELNSVIPKTINDNIVRIAINSSLQKITRKFINLCEIIKSNSSVPVEFHFFMIDNPGALVSSFEKSIQKETSINYKVHPAAPYKNYMENLSVCDLAIGTFPFGGSNTNVDLTLLGIPKIFYCDESDLASFADLNKLNKLNLPGILNATSESDVLANAIYLIHDHNERKRLSEYIKNQNAYDLFFNQGVSHEEHFFNKAINWIMENGK
jgi:hypothetical protein